jgi:hypothetical protein
MRARFHARVLAEEVVLLDPELLVDGLLRVAVLRERGCSSYDRQSAARKQPEYSS